LRFCLARRHDFIRSTCTRPVLPRTGVWLSIAGAAIVLNIGVVASTLIVSSLDPSLTKTTLRMGADSLWNVSFVQTTLITRIAWKPMFAAPNDPTKHNFMIKIYEKSRTRRIAEGTYSQRDDDVAQWPASTDGVPNVPVPRSCVLIQELRGWPLQFMWSGAIVIEPNTRSVASPSNLVIRGYTIKTCGGPLAYQVGHVVPLGIKWWPAVVNQAFYVCIMALVVVLYKACRRAARNSRGLCQSCGYDLRQLVADVCPECGHAFRRRSIVSDT